ncbi:MAG: methyl-accepting chemotaxis protein [Methanospirillum sp.]|uniref:HAMP domain-containing methyl-accepting chemotaxis protein n=1 Tax=Methanospirillum sp. TaxID=45200 RepID=UPI002370C791|nr:methyl-accepting chemotaxis protein [Methanospirillum sp.]MDD1729888.1 methyl-accepting chemotaxis protein [Methanospirillum sp.]
MIKLDDLPIGRKLLILVIIGIVAVIAVGYTGISSSGTINSQLNELYQNKYIHSMLASEAYSEMLNYAVGYYQYSNEQNPENKKNIQNTSMDPHAALFNAKIASYESIRMSDDEKRIISEIKLSSAEYLDTVRRINALEASGKEDEAAKIRTSEGVPKRIQTMDNLKKLVDANNASAYQYYQDSNAEYNNTILLIIAITVICTCLLLLISWLIIRNLTRRFALILKGMDEVGSGNLAYRIGMDGKDEIARVGSSFDTMTVNLEDQTGKIRHNLERSKQTNAAIMDIAGKIRNGDLKTKIDAEGYEGEFLVMIRGINDLLDALINPLREAMRMVNEFAERNFSARYDENARVTGDFEKFKQALDHSGISVSGSLKVIQEQIEVLTANAEEANASTEEVAASTRAIAESSSVVSENAEKSNSGLIQILKAMDDLSATVNQVAVRTDEVSKLTTEADSLSQEGVTLARVAENGMEGITKSTQDSKQIIEDIRRQMEEIGKIVGLIRDISDQTGLLALNAAIEAARAGEAGLGFAVVADEVKTLAQETQASAENIATIIENLQKRSILASDAMEKTSAEVTAGGEALHDTLSSFTRIVELINTINHTAGDVAAATEEQAAAVQEITASIHEVGGLVGDTTKEAENSSRSTNDVAAAVNQISTVINNLNGIVEQVRNEVDSFRI